MPIIIKSAKDIEFMRKACLITAGARTIAREGIAAGVTTHELDREIRKYIVKNEHIRPSTSTPASRGTPASPSTTR